MSAPLRDRGQTVPDDWATARDGTTSLTDLAYAAIRAAITDGELRPGEPIAENTLAGRLGMSRTPVREAILRLRQEGWVYSLPRRGLFVTPLSLTDFEQKSEILEGLEAMVARLVAERAPDEGIARLGALVERGEAAERDDERDAWIAASREFHATLTELAGNPHLTETRARLLDQIDRVSRLTRVLWPRPAEPTAEHRAIYEAIRARDAATAMLLAHEHRARSRREWSALAREHLPHLVAAT